MGRHNRFVWALNAFALMIVACILPAHAEMAAPRVRPVGTRLTALLVRGYAVSPTLAVLVDALEHSDIIVHVVECWLLDAGHVGDTQFVATAGRQRYLRIRLDVRLHDEAAIAMLAHELQHAWEIAAHPWVSDQNTLGQLYAQIGFESQRALKSHAVETSAARDTAREVLKEIKAHERLSSTN
jgi:hypothetical protein